METLRTGNLGLCVSVWFGGVSHSDGVSFSVAKRLHALVCVFDAHTMFKIANPSL